MFNAIAPYYDVANRFMSLGLDQNWRKALVKELNVTNDEIILDLATGTGDVALLIGKYIKSNNVLNSRLIGIDPSINMLSLAETKAKNSLLEEVINFKLGNAEDLSFYNDNSFDGITMSFGIRNVINRNKALSEIRRILKTTGRVLIMEFVPPSDGIFQSIARAFVKNVVPVIGSIVSLGHKEEYQHLEKSIFNFPTTSEFLNQLENVGFSDCTVIDLIAGVVNIFKCNK
eukprot:gene17224-22748_t